MDYELIQRWNDVVGPEDIVYHLGDFTLQDDAAQYFRQLNGELYILGTHWHHDKRWLKKLYQSPEWYTKSNPVTILPPMYVLEKKETGIETIVLCHYPLARFDRQHYGAWHLHGHCHGRYQGEGFCYDVGVDNNDFYPVNLERITEIMKSKGWYEGWKQYD